MHGPALIVGTVAPIAAILLCRINVDIKLMIYIFIPASTGPQPCLLASERTGFLSIKEMCPLPVSPTISVEGKNGSFP